MPARPNILLIYVDQLRHDVLSCAGHPDVQTPHLDRLAASSTRFTHCFVQHPLCMPSRISMLSGQYPSALQITDMGVPVPEDLVTLPHLLQRAGYTTANLGKLHFLPHANRDHRRPHPAYGFDHLEISDEPGTYRDAFDAFVRQRMPDQVHAIRQVALPVATRTWRKTLGIEPDEHAPPQVGNFTPRAFAGSDEATHSAFVSTRTCEFLDAHAASAEPFFCIAGFYSPHPPLVAPQRFLDLYDPDSLQLPEFPSEWAERGEDLSDQALRAARQGYYAMVSELDEHVGRILGQLDATGLADNTIVAFTSDHGEFLGEFGRWGKGYPAPDCVSRVPLLLRVPGCRATVESGIVEAVDIAPTLLELTGVQPPPECQGRSLVTALRGEAFDGKDGAVVEANGWRSWRSSTHRYVLRADGRESLFELGVPSGEWRDVANDADQQATLAALRHRLAMHMIEASACRERTWCY